MVLVFHTVFGWQGAMAPLTIVTGWQQTFVLPQWMRAVADSGDHGVTLFFVVSAFTLTLSFSRNTDLAAYTIRRLARVGPAYWLAAFAYSLAYGLGPRQWAPNGSTMTDVIVAALFGTAWHADSGAYGVVPGGWSVSCEVTFYAALPFLILLIQGRIWRAAALTGVTCLGLQLFARHIMSRGGWHYAPEYVNPLSQAPVFLFGITAAIVVQRVDLPRLPGAALALLAVAIFALPFSPVREWTLLPHLAFAGLVAAVTGLVAVHPPRWLAEGLLPRVGLVSYSMYLVHFAVEWPSMWLAERLLPGLGWPTFFVHSALTAAGGYALAELLHRWVEQPGIAVGRFLTAGRRQKSWADYHTAL